MVLLIIVVIVIVILIFLLVKGWFCSPAITVKPLLLLASIQNAIGLVFITIIIVVINFFETIQ